MNVSASPAIPHAVTPVALRGPRAYCSGALIAPDLQPGKGVATRFVLTCAHYFQEIEASRFTVSVRGAHIPAIAARAINGTDIAVVYLARETSPMVVAGLAHNAPAVGEHTRTFGFGGKARSAQVREGYFVTSLPFAFTRDFKTRIREAGLVFNRNAAVYGDSGGPVMVDGTIVGTQALIAEPFGRNIHVATVSLVAPYRESIRQACALLDTQFGNTAS